MFAISSSRLPPGPSQLSPLCSKIGHARTPTKTTIATTPTPTSNDTAPSVTLGAVVGPGIAKALQHLAQLIEIHCVSMIFFAAAEWSIQPMNADAAPLARPLVTS